MSPGAPRGWFGRPLWSLVLAAGWLVLQGSLAPGALAGAVLVGLVVPRVAAPLLDSRSRPNGLRGLRAMLHLAWLVPYDIVVANIAVARLALDPRAEPRPAWVPVALDITHPAGITLFASIITMTPGTVSCLVDEDRREILVHALDCDDPAQMAADMKARYEAPLMRIFG